MDFDVVSYIITILQMAVLGVLIFMVGRKLKYEGSSVILCFCLYALICILLNDLYWLASDILKPDIRIPYGAGDIADSGTFLLFAAMLGVVYRKEKIKYGIETLLVIGFSIGVTILWIGWTDEWLKNIVGGIPFAFFMWQVIMAVKKSQAINKAEAVLLGILSYLVIIVMGLSLCVSEETRKILDNIGNGIMVTGLVLVLTKSIAIYINAVKTKMAEDTKKLLAVNFLAIVWTLNATYMCEDPLYSIEDLLYTGLLSMMLVSLFMTINTEREIKVKNQ